MSQKTHNSVWVFYSSHYTHGNSLHVFLLIIVLLILNLMLLYIYRYLGLHSESKKTSLRVGFYCAERGYVTVCRLTDCVPVCPWHSGTMIGWNTLKIISRLNSLRYNLPQHGRSGTMATPLK